jgi:hypothetical protein
MVFPAGFPEASHAHALGGVRGNGFEHFSLRGSARASEGYRSPSFG